MTLWIPHFCVASLTFLGKFMENPWSGRQLTFVSLTHKNWFSGYNVGIMKMRLYIDAVIRAISLHSSLRSYVETLKDLTLPKFYAFTIVKNLRQNFIKLLRQFSRTQKKHLNSFSYVPLTCCIVLNNVCFVSSLIRVIVLWRELLNNVPRGRGTLRSKLRIIPSVMGRSTLTLSLCVRICHWTQEFMC